MAFRIAAVVAAMIWPLFPPAARSGGGGGNGADGACDPASSRPVSSHSMDTGPSNTNCTTTLCSASSHSGPDLHATTNPVTTPTIADDIRAVCIPCAVSGLVSGSVASPSTQVSTLRRILAPSAHGAGSTLTPTSQHLSDVMHFTTSASGVLSAIVS